MVNKCVSISQHSIPQSPSSSSLQTLASTISSSTSAKRKSLTHLVLAYRSPMFGTKLILNKSKPSSKHQPIKHVVNAILDEKFSNHKENHHDLKLELELELESESDWHGDMLLTSTERKANGVDLPFSLRIIKKKKQCHNQIKELAGESTHSSVKKAFSSMVFILQELQTFTLQTIHLLSYEDLQAILVRVQSDMNASFEWLFQQVFSQTPTLMVSVMILLANYSVHSISNNFTTTPPNVSMESVMNSNTYTKYDHSSMKTFCMNSGEKTTSVGGNNGGGRKFKQVASGNDGNDKFDQFDTFLLENLGRVRANEEAVSGHQMNGGLDREMMKKFVSPVTARIEPEDVEDYLRTEVLYQMCLSQEPDNPLLLANYAQFLYVVARDYDRAEDYFKRAFMVEPKDAEALNKYASFLWNVRKDLLAAEETYLEAISADPNNSFYATNYAHFLWNTGGEDTCFTLDSMENTFSRDV